MNENPYASPVIPADFSDQENQPREINITTQGKRFIHLFVDSIVMQIVSQGGAFVLGFTYALVKVSSGKSITEADQNAMQIIGFVWGLGVAIMYYAIMESLFQRTVGKFLTGTMVVTSDGRRPSFKQILGRSLARLIPFEAFSFLGSSQPVGWHDSLSGTLVVSAK